MAEYKPGEMDIREQEKTFDGFVRLSVRVAIFCVVLLILLAMFNA